MHVHVEAMNVESDNTRRITPYVTHVRTAHAGPYLYQTAKCAARVSVSLLSQNVRYVIRILEQQDDEGRGLSSARESLAAASSRL
jgi:hypothetical protein